MSKTDEELPPLGVCCNCGKKQSTLGADGFWICGMRNRWACYDCKYGKPIPSKPFACEWCTSNDIKWAQGGVYTCHRCKRLGIGQAVFMQ